MQVHAVQLLVTDDQSPEDRLAAATERVGHAAEAGADLVVLPEMWWQGYFAFDEYAETAEPIDGALATGLAELAAQHGVHLLAGSLAERDGSDLFNTTLLLDRSGETVATYRKIHLYGYGSRERQILTPGTEPVVADLDGTTVGISTCYDMRFPELYRKLVDLGAEAFLVVAGWPFPRLTAWRTLAAARAVENQASIVACNCAGEQGGAVFAGATVAFDPWGTCLGELDARPGVLRVGLDPDMIRDARREFPALQDRRL